MSILRELGVNQTVWIQLGLFFICYLSLSQFLFKPYRANIAYRKKNTGGSLEDAAALNVEVEKLAALYKEELKKQNTEAEVIYEKFKNEGLAEEELLLKASRKAGQMAIDQAKKKIAIELVGAQVQLKQEIPQLSSLIASRVLGREL